MSENDRPSFLKHVRNQSSHTSTNRLKENLASKNQHEKSDKELFSDNNTHSLPNQIRSRAEVEKGFQEYLEEKKTTDTPNRTKHYIEPPFEVSKVPSPIYGFKKPTKKNVENWDYQALSEALTKEPSDFIVFEDYVTEELEAIWKNQQESKLEKTAVEKTETVQNNNEENLQSHKVESKQERKKRMRLHRSLMNIIQEEQLGANASKRDMPSFFSDENE